MKPNRIRVLCVDDHEFLIDGLRARFDIEPDIECVGWLGATDQLLEQAADLKPDVILLDIELPGPDPFQTAGELHQALPNTRVIFLSAYVRDSYISAAVDAGAFGYFAKSDETVEIIDGIRKVARRGQFAFGPKVQARCKPKAAQKRGVVDSPTTRLDSLSPRELEVLRLIGSGLTRSAIAEALGRSAKTIDGHRENLMRKLDISDRGQLVRFAVREGLVDVAS